MAVALTGLILAGVSLTVYSKYYKTDNNKGMAIASGFYFSSNYMTELSTEDETLSTAIKNIEKIEDVAGNEEIIKLLSVKASDGAWNSDDTYQFTIEIRNNANQLLYNDADLNVGYKVEFLLLDEPLGAEYKVRKGSTGSDQSFTKNQKAELTGELTGGKLSYDEYQLEVKVTDLPQYNTARILVLAYPTSPSYLKSAKKIAGIITANYRASDVYITDQGFTIEKDLTDDNWKDRVKAESALVYQVKTTGSYFGGSQGNQAQTAIKIKWNPDMYELDKYDKYRPNPDNPDTKDNTIDEDNGEMIIKTNPYSLIEFVFFKKEGFNNGVDSMQNLNDFLSSVSAEKIAG